MDNNLKILDDFKRNDSLTWSVLNNSLKYGTIITINLIDTIIGYYKGELNELNSNTYDVSVKSFLENSLNNFFLDNYKNNYATERNSKGYISKLDEIEKNNSYKIKTNDDTYSLPVFDLSDNNNGNIKIENNNSTLYISHINNLTADKRNCYSENIGNRGYDTVLTLNSYTVDQYGHAISNIKRTVTFPKINKTSYNANLNYTFSTSNREYSVSIDNLEYLTIFCFTFYDSYYKEYFTLYVSSKELRAYGGTIKTFQFEVGQSGHQDQYHWCRVINFSATSTWLYITIPDNMPNPQEITLRKIKAYTIN